MDLLKKNNIWYGGLLALVFPIMVFGVVMMLFELASDVGVLDQVSDPLVGRRFRTMTLITLCGNIVLMQLFNKRFTQQTLRGILIVTFIAAIVWFFLFREQIFSDF